MKDAAQIQAGLRRRWLYLMPVVFVTYSLAYLGRSNFGFGAAAGLAQSLHITAVPRGFSRLSFLSWLFSLPGSRRCLRRAPQRHAAGFLCAHQLGNPLRTYRRRSATTGCWSRDRLLLGVAESLIFPSMLILLTNWFTRAERSRANAILILGNPVTVTWMAAVHRIPDQRRRLADDVHSRRHSVGAVGLCLGHSWRATSPHQATLVSGGKQRATSTRRSSKSKLPCPNTRIFARRCASAACFCCAFNISSGASASTDWCSGFRR